jgi:hypothetical protein
VMDHRVGLDRVGGPVPLPRRAEQDESRLAAVDAHGDGTAPAGADEDIWAVPVFVGPWRAYFVATPRYR